MATSSASPSAETVVLGEKRSLRVPTLKANVTLHIRLPQGYKGSGLSYPVLYMLDGGHAFHHMSGTLELLERGNHVPEMIFIGINCPDRWPNATPTVMTDKRAMKMFPGVETGRGGEFVNAICDDIIPWVNKRYRTNEYRALGGFSLTGMLSMWTFLTRSETFNAYYGTSSSMWYNDGEWVRQAPRLLKRTKGQRAVYLDVGGETKFHVRWIKRFAKVLKDDAPARIRSGFDQFKDEDHGSVQGQGFTRALRLFFEGWDIRKLDASYTASKTISHYNKLSKGYGCMLYPAVGPLINRIESYRKDKKLAQARRLVAFAQEGYPKHKGIAALAKTIEKASTKG